MVMGILGFMRGFSVRVYRAKPITKTYPHGYNVQRRALSQCSDADDSILPVLIVGAGPVGLVLSILLTKLGVKCSVLEKNKAFSNHPQAHFINNRSMEIFRKIDGLAEEIQRSQPPVDLWRKFIYCTSLTGPILGSVDHMQPQGFGIERLSLLVCSPDFDKVTSPVSVAHFSQYKLTSLLLKKLEDLNFHILKHAGPEDQNIEPIRARELLMGHECVAIKSSGQFVTVTTSRLEEGKNVERNIHCKILVGTDGAGSSVRKLLGIQLRGEKDMQNLVSVHFLSRELGQYLINERPGMLFFVFNTEAIGVLVAHDLQQGEFVVQMPFYPPQQNLADFSPEMCRELIFKLVGQELSDIDVIDIKPWVMHAEVAEKFINCDNQVILAGDAAHRFPPAGGFGMNTGIQDAHNLAWKIAAVTKGISPSSILRTYESDRRPIAIFNTALSVQNFKAAMAVATALGLNPTIANSVHRVMTSGIGSLFPSGVQKVILDGIFTLGRAQLSESLLSERNPLGSSRIANLRRIFEEGKSLQLQFPAEDLGFRYLKGALVPDNDSDVRDGQQPPTGHRREYVPSANPGSKLPHMEVQLLSNLPSEVTISILDILSVDKLEFLLIIAPLKESYHLAHSAFKVAEELKVPIKVCVLWSAEISKGVETSKKAMAPWQNYIDVVEVKKPETSLSWWSMCQMSDKGAILVRPDDHIAWRVKSAVEKDPVLEMKRVLSSVLRLK